MDNLQDMITSLIDWVGDEQTTDWHKQEVAIPSMWSLPAMLFTYGKFVSEKIASDKISVAPALNSQSHIARVSTFRLKACDSDLTICVSGCKVPLVGYQLFVAFFSTDYCDVTPYHQQLLRSDKTSVSDLP